MAAQELVRWNRQHADPLRKSIAAHSNNRDPDRRLRIGYVSSDLNRHPVGRFLLPLLEHHDKTQVEVFAYAQVRVPDETTQQLRSFIDVWRNILGLSDAATAELIRQDQIDILVDLAGHTSSNRLLVFAQKPAPVQVSYLGYPASTGLSTIDYRLTDALADPPGMTESRYSECLLRLPHCAWCYQPAASTPPIGDLPAIRNGHITFGSFNNFSKVNEPLLEWWAEILRQVPGSRLLLKAKSFAAESVQQKVRNAFLRRGITTDRLTLYPFVQANDHLGMYGQVDIALDTFPYHGTTTTCEALWMGVPVITLAGQAHVSRVGVSLLTHAGMPEWIAADADEYVFKAIQLANDLPALTNIRLKIREQMMQSPLMDAATFARNIETAYRQIWRSWTESSLK
jgi:predicted O-linked N-acetylglucosamine transferase (SPINDLY family)